MDAVALAVENGVNLVQMREKDLPDAVQLALAQRLREVTNGKALLFINDSVSIAEASGADGVQLTANSRTIASARARAARSLLIGRSVHGVDAARDAAAQGADLLVVGTVFASPTHPGQPPAGVGLVGWCRSARRPRHRHRRHHHTERRLSHAGRRIRRRSHQRRARLRRPRRRRGPTRRRRPHRCCPFRLIPSPYIENVA